VFGLTLYVSRRRIAKLGALVKPAALLKFHKALVDRKYRLLFSSSRYRRRKPDPKGSHDRTDRGDRRDETPQP
jgi:hypothetical protein